MGGGGGGGRSSTEKSSSSITGGRQRTGPSATAGGAAARPSGALCARPLTMRGRRQPAFVTRLPGDQEGTALPWRWYAHRLGLLGADGQLVPGKEETCQALDAYLREFAGLEGCGPMPDLTAPKGFVPWAGTFRWFRGETDNDTEWRWGPPRRPGVNTRGHIVYGQPITPRMVLGHLWRGLVWRLLSKKDGVSGTPDELCHMKADPRTSKSAEPSVHDFAHLIHDHLGDPAIRAAVLGPGWVGPDPEPGRLVLPRGDRWWWLSRSSDRFGWVVVDLDCHNNRSEVRAAFEARRRVMTSPGMPEPELIVNSRQGLGLHLWYRVDGQASVANRKQEEVPLATLWSGRFHSALEEAGVEVRGGALEVFPKTEKALGALPGLPFGPMSHLCRSDGSATDFDDPMEDMVRWHRRHIVSEPICSFGPLRLQGVTPEDVALVAPPSDLDDERAVPMPPAGKAPSRGRQEAVYKAKLGGVTLADAKELYEGGARPGHTNDDVGIITRLIKYHLPRRVPRSDPDIPDGVDFAALTAWDTRGERRRSFRALFRKAQPFGFVRHIREGDIRWIAEGCCTIAPKNPRARFACFVAWAFAIAWARAVNPDQTGAGTVIVGLQAKKWREWVFHYRKPQQRLMQAGVLRLAKDAVVPWTWSRGKQLPTLCAEYEVQLPAAEGAILLIDGRKELAAALEPLEGQEWFKRFVSGSKDWRTTMIIERSDPEPAVHE